MMRSHVTPPQLERLRTVLIADDESSIRLLVHATIESDEYAVVERVFTMQRPLN